MSGIAEKRVEFVLRRSSNGEAFYRCKRACSGSGEKIGDLSLSDLETLKKIAGKVCEPLLLNKDRIPAAVQKAKAHRDAVDAWNAIPGNKSVDSRTKRQYKVEKGRKVWAPAPLPENTQSILNMIDEVKKALKKNTISFSNNSFIIMSNMLERTVQETLSFLVTKCVDSGKKIVKEQVLSSKKRKTTGKKRKKTETSLVLAYDQADVNGLMKLVVQTNAWKRLNECLLKDETYSDDSHARPFTNSVKLVFLKLVKSSKDYEGMMLSASFKVLFSDIVEELTEKIGVSLTRSVEYKKMKTVKKNTVLSVLDTILTFHDISMDDYKECFMNRVTDDAPKKTATG